MKYTLLRSVLEALEAYEASQGTDEADLAGFTGWLTRSLHDGVEPPTMAPRTAGITGPDTMPGNAPHVQASRLIFGLYGYAKNYTRRALEGTPLQTIEEFTYLAALMEHGTMTKTAVIQLHTHGKTSGMDIIRRLHTLGLVEEKDNPDDKRSKVVSLTPAGQGLLFQAFGKMNAVSMLVVEPLDPQERMLLLHLLRKLDHFHREINHHKKEDTVGDWMHAHGGAGNPYEGFIAPAQ